MTVLATLEQLAPQLTVAQLLPHLTERGVVEVRGAVERIQLDEAIASLAAAQAETDALRARLAQLEAEP